MVIAVLIGFGLCFGSFVNALVWRLHELSLPSKKRVASQGDLSITRGRSMCPHCQHTLGILDLLPVISWIALRGRCRYCKRSIGWQYPLVELATALTFVASYIWWPHEMNEQGIFMLVVWLVAVVGLMALLVYDLRWMLLPNKVVFPLIVLGLLQAVAVASFFGGGVSTLLGSFASIAIGGGIFYVLFQLSKGAWIGGGDVKLGFALGLLIAEPRSVLFMLFAASVIGLVVAFPGIVSKRLGFASRVPFGPSLIAATGITVLWGASILDWYATSVLGL